MTTRFRFKPEMFVFSPSILIDTKASFLAADQANAALDEYLKTCPRVYGSRYDIGFCMDEVKECFDQHEAILFDLREIEKPECEHEPTIADKLGISGTAYPTCRKCGAKLKATWSEVK